MTRFKEALAIGRLAAWLLAGCAGYASILYTADRQEVLALALTYPRHWPVWPSALAGFEALRAGLASLAVGLGAVAWRFSRPACRRWRTAWGLAGQQLLLPWRALAPRQRRRALAALAALTALRVGVSRLLITFDDGTSYDLFVRKSLLVVSAWYPLPNNHILSNTLSWLFYQLYPGYWWSMRLPALLVSTVATAGWFLGLLRATNFRVAALAIGLFSLLELSLFFAAEGRGYPLLLVLSGVGFFSTLSLANPTAQAPRASAWAGLAGAGVLGLYTIPTFAYFLVAAYSWLALSWLRRGSRHRLASLALLGAATLLGAALLYAPLLWVSGPAALFHNQYVQPLTPAAFWQRLPSYLAETEGELLGESPKGVLASLHVGLLAAAAVLLTFVGLASAARRGRLAAPTTRYVRRLGGPAFWFVVVPYALLVGQRVLAPSRTLLFKAVFMFVLVGIEADWLLHRFGAKGRWAAPWPGAGGGGLGQHAGGAAIPVERAAASLLKNNSPGGALAPGVAALLQVAQWVGNEEPTQRIACAQPRQPGQKIVGVTTQTAKPKYTLLPFA